MNYQQTVPDVARPSQPWRQRLLLHLMTWCFWKVYRALGSERRDPHQSARGPREARDDSVRVQERQDWILFCIYCFNIMLWFELLIHEIQKIFHCFISIFSTLIRVYFVTQMTTLSHHRQVVWMSCFFCAFKIPIWPERCQKANIVTRLRKSSSALSFSLDKSFKHSTFGSRLTALIHLSSGLLSRRAAEECTNQAENRRHLCWPVKAAHEKPRWFLDVCCKQSTQFVQREAV